MPTKCRKILLCWIMVASVMLVATMFISWNSPNSAHELGFSPAEDGQVNQHTDHPVKRLESGGTVVLVTNYYGAVPADPAKLAHAMKAPDIKAKVREFKKEGPKLEKVNAEEMEIQAQNGMAVEAIQSQNLTKSVSEQKAANFVGNPDENLPEMADEYTKSGNDRGKPSAKDIKNVESMATGKGKLVKKAKPKADLVEKAPNAKYACTVPHLNPWDKSIQKFIEHYPPKVCRKVQPDLVYIDENNFLRFNETELKNYNLTIDEVECGYNTIERANNDEDFQAHVGATRALVKPVQLDKDIVQISCVMKEDRKILFSEVLAYPAPIKRKNFMNNSEDMLNVILIFIDSLSLSAMQRHMPKTYQFMAKQLGFRVMRGYNKVADNSFPNLIPILTGKRAGTQQPDMLDEFNEDVANIYFDHWPLIWKNFSAKGYMTSFSEEHPDMGLFHFKGHGFREQPVDHFYINFWKAIEWMTYPKSSTKGCFGNRTPAKILLDTIKNSLIKFKHLAQFMFMYLTFPAHQDVAQMEPLDRYYYDFFREMHQRKLFNRSFVMFLADHGPRDSVMRTTTVGLMEERLPTSLIHFPPWFYKKHPHIEKNLRLNEDRLASNFDVYETLVDILQENFGPKARQRPATNRGMSMLYPIPTNRTCRSAGIPFYFCTCQQMIWKPIPLDAAMAKYAAVDFVYALNEKVQQSPLCSRWTLKKLLNAEVMDITAGEVGVNKTTTGVAVSDAFRTEMQLVRVTVQAEVSFVNGTFQALMLFNKNEKQLNLHSDIGRLDRYGNQSSCVGTDANSQMRKLCVCRSFILNGTRKSV